MNQIICRACQEVSGGLSFNGINADSFVSQVNGIGFTVVGCGNLDVQVLVAVDTVNFVDAGYGDGVAGRYAFFNCRFLSKYPFNHYILRCRFSTTIDDAIDCGIRQVNDVVGSSA